MITKEQFDSLKVGDKVLHSCDGGASDLAGVFGSVTRVRPSRISVVWRTSPYECDYTNALSELECFDPYPQFSTININEII